MHKQNRADSGMTEIIVNPAKVLDHQIHPVGTYLRKSRRPANHQPNLAPQLVPSLLSPLRAERLSKGLHELGVDGRHRHEDVDVIVGGREQPPHEVRLELWQHRDLGPDGQGAQEGVDDAVGVVQGKDVQDIVLGDAILIQGDHSGCAKLPIDIQTKVPF